MTRDHLYILSLIEKFVKEEMHPPKASEVSASAKKPRYWATDKLRRMAESGLVGRLGSVPPWRWLLTAAGDDALRRYGHELENTNQ